MSTFRIIHADVMDGLATLPDTSFGACFCDPPYGLSFMNKAWDHGVPGPEVWREVLRVLKPGAPLLAFGGTRTFHRLACAIEDAGFILTDTLCWLYGSGFPKGHAQLKPAWEPITLAWKKGKRVLAIDAGRIGTEARINPASNGACAGRERSINLIDRGDGKTPDGRDLNRALARIADRMETNEPTEVIGRWPANVLLDEDAAAALDAAAPDVGGGSDRDHRGECHGFKDTRRSIRDDVHIAHDKSGGASRFFYIAKADAAERHASGLNAHPTVKPVDLCAYLSKLILPGEGARLIVPFSGSGSEIMGALRAGWSECVGIEREAEYVELSRRRIMGDSPMFNTESDAVCNIG